jgi:hypothetical protein
MELIEPLEQYLDAFIGILKLLLEAIAAICVLMLDQNWANGCNRSATT